MYPLLLEIAGVRLHSYGVAVAAAVLLAIWLAGLEARRKQVGPAGVEELALPVVRAGFLGGRLGYVVGWEPELLWTDPVGIVAVWRGGLALQGGLVAGFAPGVWFFRRPRLPPLRGGGAVPPPPPRRRPRRAPRSGGRTAGGMTRATATHRPAGAFAGRRRPDGKYRMNAA